AEIIRGLMSRALAGEIFSETEEFGDPDLVRPHWEISYGPLRDANGEVIGGFCRAKDVSARLRAEAALRSAEVALRQSQKMESLGSLTGGVAHDFNNLLLPIIGGLDLLQHRGVGDELAQTLIANALESAERAKTLVQRLLAFARRQPLQPTAVDIAGLAQSIADLVARTTGPQVSIKVQIDPNLPPAKADSNQVEMALLNLCVNAKDAMPDGGTLTITAASDVVEPGHRSKLPPGSYICLTVADTGTGMSEPTLARAIEPFFTTKGVGKGTGLGLSMVDGLAAQSGGALGISSKPGGGTKVELWLPVAAGEAGGTRRVSENTVPLSAGVVLLVDDQDLVRKSIAEMLTALDFQVVEAAGAEEAIRLCSCGLSPDLLVSDYLMPAKTGVELAHELRERIPSLPVLIVSGYEDVYSGLSGFSRLTKPFRRNQLARALSDILPDAG
ncbi:MAG: response regulator, partial [Oxalobacteraceae bacterium]